MDEKDYLIAALRSQLHQAIDAAINLQARVQWLEDQARKAERQDDAPSD